MYENPILVLGAKGDKLLFRRESKEDPPNYYIKYLHAGDGGEVALTDFSHPQPQLAGTSSELIKYARW